MAFTSLGSLSTGGWQYFDKIEIQVAAEQKRIKAVHDVAAGFQMVMSEPKPIKVIKPNCSKCTQQFNILNDRINKWHN